MAEPKKSESKKEETPVEKELKNFRNELDMITFKNDQAKRIKAIQEGKEKLKERLSSNRKKRVSSSSRISGLGKLGGLATFKQKYKEY